MDRKIDKKKWPPKKIAALAAGGLLFVVLLYSLLWGDSSTKYHVEAEKMTIAEVKRGPFQEFIPVNGTVLPLRTIYLDAIEGGRVEKIMIEAGSLVTKGDEILQLGNTNLLLDIMFREAELFEQSNNLRTTRLQMEQNRLELRSQLVELEYQLKRLHRVYQRSKELQAKELISQQEFEQAKDEYEYYRKRKTLALETYRQDSLFRAIQIEQLEASLDRMQDNLEIVKTKLDNLTIKAPITGQLTSLNAEVGESKSPGERLGQVDVLEGFKVRAEIDEHYLSRIMIGLEGKFDFAGETYELVTEKVYPEIRNGRFDVDLAFTGTEPDGIRRGQTLRIRLALGDLSEALMVDRGGFYQTTGGQWAYVVDESGEFATKRSIRLGRQNTLVFEVLDGLEAGQRVITSSYDHFDYNRIDKLILK